MKDLGPVEDPDPPLVQSVSTSSHTRIVRMVTLTVTIALTVMFCGGPFFVPYLALPLAQEVRYLYRSFSSTNLTRISSGIGIMTVTHTLWRSSCTVNITYPRQQ